MVHPAFLPIPKLLTECEVHRTRRSGPGGQHRNKVETAIVIEHLPTGIKAEASERRNQEENRRIAVHRLRIRLALEHRTTSEERPTPLWQSRVAGGKLAINLDHEDFPALLAEALNMVWQADFQLPEAASRLGVSGSQLVKFLKLHPEGLARVNRHRQERGETKYR